jgi:hypothetical protein
VCERERERESRRIQNKKDEEEEEKLFNRVGETHKMERQGIRHNDADETSSTVNKHIQKGQTLTEVQRPAQPKNGCFLHKNEFENFKELLKKHLMMAK